MNVSTALEIAMRESHLTAGAVLYSVGRDIRRRAEWDCIENNRNTHAHSHHTHTFEGALDEVTDKQLTKDLMMFASGCWFLWHTPWKNGQYTGKYTKPPTWVKRAGIPYSSTEDRQKHAHMYGVRRVKGY